MTIDSRKQLLKTVKQRKYLNKDFDGLRADLLEYARSHFGDRIRDFSETSLGGLLLEMPAYVGDVQSFYLDHQFQELSLETAVEPRNIERLLRADGVDIVGASPAVVDVTFYVEVPADTTVSPRVPSNSALPIIFAGSIVQAESGVQFELTEDIDFSERDNAQNLVATYVIGKRDSQNLPTTFILSLTEVCISGFRATETFSVGAFEPFKVISLANENVTDIISVTDSTGNEYYKVDYLTQDTVFKALLNRNDDNELVKENLTIIPAPYRFTTATSAQTRLTSLTFGGGTAQSLDDDIIPDPSEFALPLYGKRTFSRFTLDPANLLNTTTLGVLTPNTTLSVTYRYGGGLSHNITANTIRGVKTLSMSFPNGPSASVSQFVRASVDAVNLTDAGGGDDAPTLDELKLRAPAARAAQGRIVTKEDVLARIYTMPSNFGRVYRASIRSNPNNPLASQLFIISRNAQNQFVVSPDSLKKNLITYLNQFRMISDAIDILDSQVINLKVEFTIVVDPNFNRNLVLQNVISRIKKYFNIKNFDIDQPIVLSDLNNIIYNNPGVISVQSVKLRNMVNTVADRVYSSVQFDVESNITKGILIGPAGSIFEVRFKDFDIIGTAI
jgi:hypothetical protein